jgi:hypothetical protein
VSGEGWVEIENSDIEAAQSAWIRRIMMSWSKLKIQNIFERSHLFEEYNECAKASS